MSASVFRERHGTGLRRTWLVGVSAAALTAAMSMVGLPTALAVHDTGAFELDGNATNSSSSAGDDWDNVCYQAGIASGLTAAAATTRCTTSSPTNGATAVSWVAEANLNSSIFTGGGSKDPQDISSWAWKDGAGGLPDKDNLLHSFATRYSLTPSASCPSGSSATCDLLFFGSDRYDNSGDAQQGFWFFQNAVGLGSNAVGGGTGFTGVHRDGDLLVISDFSNGGTTSTITVYTWDSTCKKAGGPCSDVNLRILESSTSAKCSSTLAGGDQFCGIVNPGPNTTVSPWPFKDKSNGTSFLNGEFYEGGINLSLMGLSGECFATVASETRSSTSTTATLKDFVLGNFGDCTSRMVTTPKLGDGSAIPSTGASIGAGSVDVRDSARLTVGGAATWTGNVAFSLCGPLTTAPADSNCTTGGTSIGDAIPVTNTTSQPILSPVAAVTSVGTYCWRADFTSTKTGVPNASDGSSTECFAVVPVTPTLATSAGADVTVGSKVTDTATLTGYANKPGDPVINPTTTGAAAGGSITFTLYGPGNCTTVASGPTTVAVDDLDGGGRGASVESGALSVAGTYHWVASYSGDSPNTLSTTHNTACNDTAEDVIVGASSVVTTPKNGDGTADLTTTSITTGGSVAVRDSANVSVTGISPWTGTLAFHLCGPLATVPASSNCTSGGTLIGATPITVTQATTQPVLGPQATITAAGTYCWRADFDSGTTGVPDASDGTSGECFAVTPVTPDLTTLAGPDVPVGSTVSDTATLTGYANKPGDPVINPTTAGGPAEGTITFTLYGPDNCTDIASGPTTVDVGDLSPSARGATVTSDALTEAGTYHWVASYSGDGPNTLGTDHNTDCTDKAEDVVVSGASLVTTPKNATGTTTVTSTSITTAGAVTVRDSADLTVTGASTWSGSLTFYLCGTPATDCATGGTAVGDPIAVSDTDTMPVLGPQTTIHSAGTYCWRADFTSSTTGVPNASDGSAGECFTVTPVTPTLGTLAGAAVDLGGAVTDSATLSGAALRPDGTPAAGTITFHLFGPSTTGCGAEFTSTFGITKDVGDLPGGKRGAQITAADNVVPVLPGTYHWVATYSGDDPNTLGATHNADCSDSLEDVIVNQFQPTIATAQSWVPNDTATLTVAGGGNLTGSIQFELFDNDTCTGDALYDSGDISVSGASPQEVSTSNTLAFTSDVTVSWRVIYTSTNSAHLGVTSTCNTEHSSLSITNE